MTQNWSRFVRYALHSFGASYTEFFGVHTSRVAGSRKFPRLGVYVDTQKQVRMVESSAE